MNKIILCCPFYNENLVADINIAEASKWVDEIHITEFDKSFKYTSHDYMFQNDCEKVHYHQMDASRLSEKPRKFIPHFFIHPISRWMNKMVRDTAWYNDGVSRNFSLWNSNYKDDDILILSDIDEIIDSKYANEIIDAVNQYGIITIKIHFTMFYFNLFCSNWSGPAYYSYRIFIVKGKYLRKRFYNDSDYLRKMGEQSNLLNKVKCLEGIKGYHHSWLGDEKFVVNKLKSYAHTLNCHSKEIFNDQGEIDIDVIKNNMRLGKSIFADISLNVNNEIELLSSVEKLKKDTPEFFL
ncbi:hypothetical protein [Bacteroides xylanisolvens]|uniref:hypothetical protein n=1 Tax=Bacteroides xylanisolvens TaxID=371601 RepID=UPI0023B9B90C|nr:hypothetical protein [Bacteroides xylanisolvens]MDF0566760.1 hypothetical protein [Bacteroides xylanisolvens]